MDSTLSHQMNWCHQSLTDCHRNQHLALASHWASLDHTQQCSKGNTLALLEYNCNTKQLIMHYG